MSLLTTNIGQPISRDSLRSYMLTDQLGQSVNSGDYVICRIPSKDIGLYRMDREPKTGNCKLTLIPYGDVFDCDVTAMVSVSKLPFLITLLQAPVLKIPLRSPTTDFLGQELEVGDWLLVATSTAGGYFSYRVGKLNSIKNEWSEIELIEIPGWNFLPRKGIVSSLNYTVKITDLPALTSYLLKSLCQK